MSDEQLDLSETWKNIPGYDGHYMVSDQGRILSVDRRARTRNHFGVEATRRVPSRIMHTTYNRSVGRIRVELSRDGITEKLNVHKLVLEAFAGPCPPGCYGEFINGDTRDNRLANLRWARLCQWSRKDRGRK
jgi:NUMOD4 motif/HNH endonuclease